jgi:DHA2 family multidrug resistance protein-like MFS transporter
MILGVMAASLTLVVMSVSGLNVALPTIQESLEASNSALQWIIDSYALVFAGLLLMAGALGDRFGRRNALLVGLSIFATGAAVGGLAASAVQVIAGRVVMGAGAAFVMPATLSLVTTVFPPDERRRAIAVWAGFAGAGAAIGPIVSGTLLEAFWWGSALLVNIPIVILLMIAIAMLAPHSRDPHNTPLDPAGTVLSLIGITALVTSSRDYDCFHAATAPVPAVVSIHRLRHVFCAGCPRSIFSRGASSIVSRCLLAMVNACHSLLYS